MPIQSMPGLPAQAQLAAEGFCFFDPALPLPPQTLRVLIVNLMPKKMQTETQLLRMLSHSPLPIQVTLMQTATHRCTHTPAEHMERFYTTFPQVEDQTFDGMILTGAPVEMLDFEQVDYWEELCRIMAWSKTHVRSTLHICWGAQAGLYYHYGIPKHPLPEKRFGVFEHRCCGPAVPLIRGFDPVFKMPHSRHTEVREEEVQANPALQVLSVSPQAGLNLCASTDGSQVFIFSHSEYDADTLSQEYFRDISTRDDVPLPCCYFPNDDPTQPPVRSWSSHAALFYTNWLHWYVRPQQPLAQEK